MAHSHICAETPLAFDTAMDESEWRHTALTVPASLLIAAAAAARDVAHPRLHTYSRKVFIPLTKLCRDYCHYCTFSRDPASESEAFMSREAVLEVARAGAAAGCSEALFTLGDKPELRHARARRELDVLGYGTTIDYLEAMCSEVIAETGLLPHVNAGVMSDDELTRLRRVSASQGLMLETSSARLSERGGPHFRSPDKDPELRLAMLTHAGELAIPFTSGILIGIGETRDERLDALFRLRDLHERYGHIQEIIIQNFRAKPGTPMHDAPEPTSDELMWTIAAARLIFGPQMSIQAPPNLSGDDYAQLIDAGINDWGGVSPVTRDFVNPEAPWPMLSRLRAETARKGRVLSARLPIYPSYVHSLERWVDPALAPAVHALADSSGLQRDRHWRLGETVEPPARAPLPRPSGGGALDHALKRAACGEELETEAISTLFAARDADADAVCKTADAVRRNTVGDTVTFVVNRNINYTNICAYSCGFCAFSKGRGRTALRGAPYMLDIEEIARRAREAVVRGATEVCLQGGIHPSYTGETYLEICSTVRSAAPELHIHAFSPLEITHGAGTLGMSVPNFLRRLKDAGLSSLPGTAAEILDDEVRAQICPDKLSAAEWLRVIESAHDEGLRTTATIMFGHLEQTEHWTRHLLAIRALQKRTNGITEFVPLPFVHMEAPLALRGDTRHGPTWRETRLMHAVARLALHPFVPNIQTSWAKLGQAGAARCLESGANDLGGTLMNESISRAAGAAHGQELAPTAMEQLIGSIGRVPRQRTTLYGAPSDASQRLARVPPPLEPIVQTRPSAPNRMLPA